MRHVFRAADRRRLRSIYAKEQEIRKKDVFAFGPFLAFGLALAALYGNQIVTWYLHFL